MQNYNGEFKNKKNFNILAAALRSRLKGSRRIALCSLQSLNGSSLSCRLLVFCLTFFVLNIVTPSTVIAARLSFDPVTTTASAGASFDIKVRVDTANVPTTSSDALISFDESILEVVKTTAGKFYPEYLEKVRSGKLRVGGTVTRPLDARTGAGILSTITFRGKKLGSAKVSFDCLPGETTDSNVTQNDPDATDVLNCNQLIAASYTISASAGGITTPTPTQSPSPTPTPTNTATPTPPPTPVAGTSLPTILLLGTGLTAIITAFFLIL